MKKINYTRETLYDLVWSYPIIAIEKKYLISGYEIKKACIDREIPMPKMGYWNKIQFGQEPEKISLPPSEQVFDELVLQIRRS